MSWIAEPFAAEFFVRALLGGCLVAVVCGIVGTWVVIRGMAFFGDAVGHGMLPGVALATVLGLPLVLGAAVSATAMSLGVSWLQRRGQTYDTSIGLLFVGMLSLGVIIVSHSRSFATDATRMLFGDVLAVTAEELLVLTLALGVTVTLAVAMHRAFVAAAFDERTARTLGLRPRLANVVLSGLMTLAVVATFRTVGTLLVVGLLLAPAVAANRWARRIPSIMIGASAAGIVAVLCGLLVSWFAAIAAGPAIVMSALAVAGASAGARAVADRVRRTRHVHVAPLERAA